MNDHEIWIKYRDELIRYATALVGPSESEDVLSTVVARILRRRRLSELDDPRAYLYRAVLNESRSVGRKRGRPSPVGPERHVPTDVRPEVLEAVLALPARQRAAAYLYYWRDLPVAEVAQLMHCRPGTVKRYLHMARKNLKETLR